MTSLRFRLTAGLVVLLVFIVGQAAVTYYYIANSERLVTSAIGSDFGASAEIGRIVNEGQKIRRIEKEFFIYLGDPGKRAKYRSEWKESFDKLKETVTAVAGNTAGVWTEADVTEAGRWREALDFYGDGFDLVAADAEAGRITSVGQANEAIQEAKERFRTLLDGATRAGDARYAYAQDAARAIAGNFRMLDLMLGALAAGGLIVVGLLIVVLPPAVTRPIAALAQSARNMSTGDLDRPVPATGIAEFSELSEALERSRISQKTVIERLRSAAALRQAS